MMITAQFEDGKCQLLIKPIDYWEKVLLGAVAKGKDTLTASVEYKPEGHFSYGKCEAVMIYLSSSNNEEH